MRSNLAFLLLPSFGLLACGGPTVPFETLEHDGEQREYYLYAPATLDSAQAAPLLFNFHGNGQTAGDQVAWSDFRPLADEHGFLVVYPQGADLQGSTHWNSALPGNGNKSSTDDFGFLLALIDNLSERYNVDPNRIATGYSNGGFMSYSLACYHSDRFAAISRWPRPCSISSRATVLPRDRFLCSARTGPRIFCPLRRRHVRVPDHPGCLELLGRAQQHCGRPGGHRHLGIQRTLYSGGDQVVWTTIGWRWRPRVV